ncbi:unnamed protein product [Hyaloperonospora brassicae]|uniref:CAF1B/HIR1 beta-propeller domain-containing protein n=1 Tax=Hyaloperonospora brassicae TaxID=162125 RepID=A0AAV0T319_HYABA|nr:unnamed protein product [Hyaloperonospora brassicae]
MAVRVTTPEIRLHCGPTGLNEAVLSLDFLHLHGKIDRDAAAVPDTPLLATGGADKEIKLWRVSRDADATTSAALEFVFSLSGHDRSVNCVRFSPNGAYLASASDDTSIILWTKPKTAGDDWRWDHISSLSDVGRKILSLGHKGDITDLSWSPDSAFLCSTSVDNRCVIWDVEKGDVAERRKDHTQYVQGVAWDPLNELLVTESNDRTCRVYSLSGFGAATRPDGKKQRRKFVGIQTLKTREFGAPQSGSTGAAKSDNEGKESVKNVEDAEGTSAVAGESAPKALLAQKHRMFLDDTCPAFSRRPAWTPDGSYFLAPTGTFRASESATAVNTVYAFSRGNLSQPTLHLPGQKKASLGVRCSPLLYELRRQSDHPGSLPLPNFFKTEYRSVFAVITLDAVIIYDTQQSHPICTIRGLHYADLTDAAWTADGQVLSISSTDGYLSIIQFEDGFFGTSVSREDQVALNETKMRRMFATPKKVRKKARSQVLAQTTPKEQPPAKASLTKSRPQQVSDPVMRVNQNSEGHSAANPVNLLQVRKKRKASPVVVPAAATSVAHASSTSASSAPLTSSAPAHGTETTVRDQVSPSPELVSVETQPTEAPPTEEHTRGSGAVDDRLSM